MTQSKEKVMALIQASSALNPIEDAALLRQNFAMASALVDKAALPTKWAGIQTVFAQMLAPSSPAAAIHMYRQALTVFNANEHREFYLDIHARLGELLSLDAALNPQSVEQAIVHMEIALIEYSDLAPALAYLYEIRSSGDRQHNWNQRMHYLTRAVALHDAAADPVRWARANNEVARAWGDQPNGDFATQCEKRLSGHRASLAALELDRGEVYIQTQIWLGETYQYRVAGDERENQRHAERCAFDALGACTEATTVERHRTALQAAAQSIAALPARRAEALALLDRAEGLLNETLHPEALADVERSRAALLLETITATDTSGLAPLVKSTQRARRLLGATRPDRSLVLCRIEGEACFAAGDFGGAVAPLSAGLDLGHAQLLESSSVAGRMETIHDMGNLSGLLCHSLAQQDKLTDALIALERGKGLVWNTQHHTIGLDKMREQVPADGALLFGCFAGREGLVLVVTETATACVTLPALGKDALMTLQRGPQPDKELGGWLLRYMSRRSERKRWQRAVLDMGRHLYDVLWAPVLAALDALDVPPHTELVWLHHGGSSALPVHAAWTGDQAAPTWLLDQRAVRFAPSLKALDCANDAPPTRDTVIVSDPSEDLATEELENAWIAAALGNETLQILRGADASRTAVLDALPAADIVHFATHAQFDTTDPWQSALTLAGGETLTVSDCRVAMADGAPALVTLGACETAVTRVTAFADEFLGFPAAFLHAGTRTVLATVWPVDDRVSAFIAGRFYAGLRRELSPAQALRQAQNWLRQATAKELRQTLAPLFAAGGRATTAAANLSLDLRDMQQHETPFSAPHLWAAFTVSGQ